VIQEECREALVVSCTGHLSVASEQSGIFRSRLERRNYCSFAYSPSACCKIRISDLPDYAMDGRVGTSEDVRTPFGVGHCDGRPDPFIGKVAGVTMTLVSSR
jgi:hypothetical protein